jgi:hypothetical protein
MSLSVLTSSQGLSPASALAVILDASLQLSLAAQLKQQSKNIGRTRFVPRFQGLGRTGQPRPTKAGAFPAHRTHGAGEFDFAKASSQQDQVQLAEPKHGTCEG